MEMIKIILVVFVVAATVIMFFLFFPQIIDFFQNFGFSKPSALFVLLK